MVQWSMRDLVAPGYSIESTWGTDPVTARLPFLGDVQKITLGRDKQARERRAIGSGADPRGFTTSWQKNSLSMEMDLLDDNPSNSLVALALGSAPDPSTGVITVYPDATHPNLRSATIDWGTVAGGISEYWTCKGAMLEELVLNAEDEMVSMQLKWVVKTVVRSTTRAATAPTTPTTTDIFHSFRDVYLSVDGYSTGDILKSKLSVANKLNASPALNKGNTLSRCRLAGRKVDFEASILRNSEDDSLTDKWEADAETAALDVKFQKNSDAEYIHIQLANARLMNPHEYNASQSDEEMAENWKWQAKTVSADVKA